MIDTHCHLDVGRFDEDREAVLERAWAAGLTGMVVPAIGPDAWSELVKWPGRDRRVQVALGIHPQLLPELAEAEDEAHLATLDRMLGEGGAVAVGECGLDGASQEGAALARQVKVLKTHFALARKHDLPILVHCLRLQPALVSLLKEEELPRRGVLLHSYSGGAELAKFYVARGCHFSFAGPVTFTEGRKPLEAARVIPLERLMGETDAPDQAPTPHRGSRSEPAYLPLILEGMARARGEDPEIFARQTTANANAFFGGVFG